MVAAHAEAAGSVGCGNGRRVAEREDDVNGFFTERRHGRGGSFLRVGEAYSDGVVAPRVGEFVAAVGDVGQMDAKPVGGGFESSGLVAELGGEKGYVFLVVWHRIDLRIAEVERATKRRPKAAATQNLRQRWRRKFC